MTAPLETGPPRSSRWWMVLTFPLFGLLIAALLLFTNALRPAARIPPTPPAITLPPMPTAVNVSGEALIDFTLPTLTGDPVSLRDYVGRVVFLNFWATWCEPCRRELPAFVNFMREQTGPADPIILAVNLEETPEQIYQFMAEEGLDLSGLPILLDRDGTTADSYGVFNIPVTFVIDQTGIVRYPSYGEMTRTDIDNYLTALAVLPLNETPAATPAPAP